MRGSRPAGWIPTGRSARTVPAAQSRLANIVSAASRLAAAGYCLMIAALADGSLTTSFHYPETCRRGIGFRASRRSRCGSLNIPRLSSFCT